MKYIGGIQRYILLIPFVILTLNSTLPRSFSVPSPSPSPSATPSPGLFQTFKVAGVASDRVLLDWKGSSFFSPLGTILIQRKSESDQAFGIAVKIKGTLTSYTDSTLQSGQTYYYQLKSSTALSHSNILSVKTDGDEGDGLSVGGLWLLGSNQMGGQSFRVNTNAIVTDSLSGETVVGGFFSGDVDVGNSVKPPRGLMVSGRISSNRVSGQLSAQNMAFVARYWPNGALKWVKTWGGSNFGFFGATSEVNSLSLDSLSDVVVGGDYQGSFALGATAISAGTGLVAYVLKLSANDGSVRWIQAAETERDARVTAVKVLANDEIAVGAWIRHYNPAQALSVKWGGHSLMCQACTAGFQSLLVSKLSSTGKSRWSKLIGGNGSSQISTIGSSDSGKIWIYGDFTGNIQVENKLFSNAEGSDPNGTEDLFLIQYSNSSGSVESAVTYGSKGRQKATGLIVDPSGNVYLSGYFDYSSPFNIQNLQMKAPPISANQLPGFLVKLDAKGNALLGLTTDANISSFAWDPLEYLLINGSGSLGSVSEACDHSSGPVGYRPTYIARLSISDLHCHAVRYSVSNYGSGAVAISIGPNGAVWSTGYLINGVNFSVPSKVVGEVSQLPGWLWGGIYSSFLLKLNP